MKAYCLNNISPVALAGLKNNDVIVEDIIEADSILVRSAKMHEVDLPNNILAVARAGAGVNNIPLDKYAEAGIVVFNTPGANANAVKELVLCGLFLSCRDIIGGLKYIEANTNDLDIATHAEKEKAKYAGIELKGKTIAVVGLGVIGVMVANACIALGMWLVLKLLTFVFTPLPNILRWPLHLLFLASCALWIYFLYLHSLYQAKKRGRS